MFLNILCSTLALGSGGIAGDYYYRVRVCLLFPELLIEFFVKLMLKLLPFAFSIINPHNFVSCLQANSSQPSRTLFPLRDSTPCRPKGSPFGTFSEIHFWPTDPKFFLKAPWAPIYTNFERRYFSDVITDVIDSDVITL